MKFSFFMIFSALLAINFSCQTQLQSSNRNLPEAENKQNVTTSVSSDLDEKWNKEDEIQASDGKIKVWIEDITDEKKENAKSSIYLQKQNADKILLVEISGENQKFTSLNLSPNGKWLIVNFEGDCKAVYEHKFSGFSFLMNLLDKDFFYISDIAKILDVKTNEDAQGWLIEKPATLRTFYKYDKNAKPAVDVQLPDHIKTEKQTFKEKFGDCIW